MTGDHLFHLLLALAAVIGLGRALGAAFDRIGQPAVIGEVMAGIALGPSLLGRVWPAGQAYLLPNSVAPLLAAVAQLGVVVYMFLVGLELDLTALRQQARIAVVISFASLVTPFTLGVGLAYWLHATLAAGETSFATFALFLGVAMSITAFPVLARILDDRGWTASPLGVLALSCGAVDDAVAWCLLALMSGVAQSDVAAAAWTVLGAIIFVGAMLLIVRPLLRPLLERAATANVLGGLLVLALLSAATTEWIGIHALFGAFLLGAIVPAESRLARETAAKLRDAVGLLLLPAFFAITGMRTQIGLVSGPTAWLQLLAIIAVAMAGKFGGTFVAGRLAGLDGRTAAALGALMNTRGLMELIVLNVGLDTGVISPTLFAMMVLMALVTTLATAPLLSAIGVSGPPLPPQSRRERGPE